MFKCNRICRWLSLLFFCYPFFVNAGIPVKSIVIFGDSLSDTGNTTHLLKSLRQEESPTYLVAPFKAFVLNKMTEFANDYYVPQTVLDAGIGLVTQFFDYELAPYLANLVSRIKLVPILPGKPYWNSRFSNGPVWNEYLAKMWSIQMSDPEVYVNQAFGGSWAATYDYELTVWNLIRHPLGTIKTLIVGKLIPPSLGFVVQAYLLQHEQVDGNAVYFVFAGSNDYFDVLFFEDKYNPAIMSRYVDNVLDNLSASVLKLANAGAKRFVIMGIPHIGDMPKHAKTMNSDVLNAAVDQHNERLQMRMEVWKKSHPNADFLFINTQNYLAKTIANAGQYGFTHLTDACIDVQFPMFNALAHSPFAKNYVLQYSHILKYRDEQFTVGQTNYHVCDAPEHYLFWDDVHMTTRAHQYLALEVCAEMKAHGYDVNCKLAE